MIKVHYYNIQFVSNTVLQIFNFQLLCVVLAECIHLNALLLVLLLLGAQSQLNEQLLQLLVAVVDAELLKAVLPKDLKPVNVEQSHHILPVSRLQKN